MNIKDRLLTGFVPGIILPLFGGYIYYLLFFKYMGLHAFINHIIKASLVVSVISIGVILNLGLFFIFYRINKDQCARGVIGATFIYAFIVLYFKVLK